MGDFALPFCRTLNCYWLLVIGYWLWVRGEGGGGGGLIVQGESGLQELNFVCASMCVCMCVCVCVWRRGGGGFIPSAYHGSVIPVYDQCLQKYLYYDFWFKRQLESSG